MSGFDDLDYLIDQPQKVLDLLDNDLLDIKNIKHAGICVSSIFNEVNKNLDNGFWLSFAIRLKSKELMYFYDDKKIIYSYKNLFNLIILLCLDTYLTTTINLLQ